MGQIFIDNNIATKDDPELFKKEMEYLAYIDEHVANVMKAYTQLFAGIKDEDINSLGLDIGECRVALRKLKKQIPLHDASKYDDEEFYGYRARFHKTKKEEERLSQDELFAKDTEENWDRAWTHHYKNNWHHPNAWIWLDEDGKGSYIKRDTPRSEAIEMPLNYVLEMMCDWHAMDIKFNTKLKDWYSSDRSLEERRCMHPNTKALVDKLVEWISTKE
jgi:hypothetical protein